MHFLLIIIIRLSFRKREIVVQSFLFYNCEQKTYGTSASSNYQFGRRTNTRYYFPTALHHSFADENRFVAVVVSYSERMISESPCHVFIVGGWDECLVLFHC